MTKTPTASLNHTATPRINTSSEAMGPYQQLTLTEQEPLNAPYQQLEVRPAGQGAFDAPYEQLSLNHNNGVGNPAVVFPPPLIFGAPYADVDLITPSDFANITQICDVGEGKSFAMFVRCAKGMFFIKSDADCHNEFVAAELFKTLPVNVPQIRLVEVSLFHTAIKALRSPNYTNRNCKNLAAILEKNPQFMLQQTLVGTNLKYPHNMNEVLLGAAGRARLFIIGMMAAYDLVIENCDRFPSVVSKHENFGNLMMARLGIGDSVSETVRPSAIDQKVSDFSNDEIETGLSKYKTDIFLKEAVESPGVRQTLADAIVTNIRSRLAVHPDAVNAVRDGITEGLAKLASGNQAALKELKQRLFKTSNSTRSRERKILDDAVTLLASKNFVNEEGRIVIKAKV